MGEEAKIVVPKGSVAMVARIFHPIMSGARHLAMFDAREAISGFESVQPGTIRNWLCFDSNWQSVCGSCRICGIS